MKEDYIRDEGKIRNCQSNIAKMNWFEYIIFDVKNGMFSELLGIIIESLKYLFHGLGFFILYFIFLICFPITLIMRSFFIRRKAKQAVEQENEWKKNDKK